MYNAMAKVEIYTWRTCPFCVRAKGLLDRKGVSYTEHSVDGDEPGRDAMAARGDGRRSVPQVYIDDRHIGGCDDLHALERAGELDALALPHPAREVHSGSLPSAAADERETAEQASRREGWNWGEG